MSSQKIEAAINAISLVLAITCVSVLIAIILAIITLPT